MDHVLSPMRPAFHNLHTALTIGSPGESKIGNIPRRARKAAFSQIGTPLTAPRLTCTPTGT
eukprot:2577558-Prorocentrum_lima.AAC.1